jgi:hypothetical protein
LVGGCGVVGWLLIGAGNWSPMMLRSRHAALLRKKSVMFSAKYTSCLEEVASGPEIKRNAAPTTVRPVLSATEILI